MREFFEFVQANCNFILIVCGVVVAAVIFALHVVMVFEVEAIEKNLQTIIIWANAVNKQIILLTKKKTKRRPKAKRSKK